MANDNMIVKQLSVFLENKTGRLNHVAEILGKEGINMTAFSVADNSDFGILRVIVHEAGTCRQDPSRSPFRGLPYGCYLLENQ